MTITEVCTAIEAETHSKMWAEAPVALRLLVIKSCVEQWDPVPAEAAKKVVKVRKTRKPKQAPLTQHAEGIGGQLVY